MNRLRTLFISDVHLGARECQAELLLEFLKEYTAETIYLVGDIVDGWVLSRKWYWPESHHSVVEELLRRAKGGTRVVYIPGNHDEFLRGHYGTYLDVEVMETAVHETAGGKRYLVIHGDFFDSVIVHAKWLALLGDHMYDVLLRLNRVVNWVRNRFGLDHWSLSAWAKERTKAVVNFISQFEQALATEAAKHGATGVVCGHIHTADISRQCGIDYVNCGDWVESCTAIGEFPDGRLEILRP